MEDALIRKSVRERNLKQPIKNNNQSYLGQRPRLESRKREVIISEQATTAAVLKVIMQFTDVHCNCSERKVEFQTPLLSNGPRPLTNHIYLSESLFFHLKNGNNNKR